MTRRGRLLVTTLVASVLVAGVALFVTREPPDDFSNDAPGKVVVIAVTEGQTLAEIGQNLVDAGVVKTMTAFLRAVEANPDARKIQPGGHRVDSQISAALAIEQMLERKRITGLLTLFEGIRLTQIVERLIQAGLESDSIDKALGRLDPPFPRASSLEGFLLPGQYVILPDTTAESALSAMLGRFERVSNEIDLPAVSDQLGVSPLQAVVIASLLQAEAHPRDYSKVLRVILNRLEIGMPLQLDATVLYALNRFGDVRVSTRDLQVVSPYNTYRNRGLPPGPINNPGVEALEALANPAEGDWLYYITVKPGDTRFTRSHDQFIQWKVEFRKNYEAGRFE